MNFQICPLTVRINGQINGIGCGVSIFETYGCVAKNVETVGCRTKLTLNINIKAKNYKKQKQKHITNPKAPH